MQDTPYENPRPIARDEALMWLNDRLGRPATVDVEVDRGEDPVAAIYSTLRQWSEGHPVGENALHHWSENHPIPVTPVEVDDMAGMYDVAGVTIDVTDLDRPMWLEAPREASMLHIKAWRGKSQTLIIDLDKNVQMRVRVWEQERSEV